MEVTLVQKEAVKPPLQEVSLFCEIAKSALSTAYWEFFNVCDDEWWIDIFYCNSCSAVVKKTFKESYTLARDLGSGAFSVVKLAVHKVMQI